MARLAVLALLLTVPAGARASGFLLYEHSGRALGMGSAVSAGVRDATAAWFNPAALAFVDARAGAAVTGALAWGGTRFLPAEGGDPAASGGPAALVPSLYGHARLHDRVQIGLAALVPFGIAVSWPEDWVGAQHSLETKMAVLSVNPSAAVRLGDRLALAAGVALLHADVELGAALPPIPGGRADLAGDGWGVAGNLAVLWRPRPDALHVAATYRSRAKLPLAGDARFRTETPGLEELFADQPVSGDLTVPDLLTAGVMWRPRPELELAADVGWTLWSAFDRVAIHFERSRLLDRDVAGSESNPLTGRLGAELTLPRHALALRAGISFDRSAARPDTLAPSAPDGDRLSLCAGIGWTLGRVQLDVGYLHAHFLAARAEAVEGRPAGTYRSRARALAFTIGVR